MQDPYWAALFDFLSSHPPLGPTSLAPQSVVDVFPGLMAYEQWSRDDRVNRVIIHKGLIEEVPRELLEILFGRASPSFANDVFVVYDVALTKDNHVRAAEEALAKRIAGQNESPASLVNASEALLRKPSRIQHVATRRVVAALQSPTLLSNWARSGKWELQVAELGDPGGISEPALLTAPKWDGVADDVIAVLVTTPDQLMNAARTFPKAKRIWIPHNGQGQLIPRDLLKQIDGIVTLSRRVLDLQRTQVPQFLGKPAWVIPPSYLPTLEFGWSNNMAWSMKSRPKTRNKYELALFSACQERASRLGIEIKLFGEDTQGRFLDDKARMALYKSCSCYVSPLPPWAGFGLSQHECMAAGVPVAGFYWGDVREVFGPKYPSLVYDLDSLAEIVKRLCIDESFATRVSEAGHAYIKECLSPASMDQAIITFLEEINGCA